MGLISLSIPQVGQPNATEDAKIASNFVLLQRKINGGLDVDNLSSSIRIPPDRLALTRGRLVNSEPVSADGAIPGLSVTPASGDYFVVAAVSTQVSDTLIETAVQVKVDDRVVLSEAMLASQPFQIVVAGFVTVNGEQEITVERTLLSGGRALTYRASLTYLRVG